MYGSRVTNGGMVGSNFVNSESWRYVKNGCDGVSLLLGGWLMSCVI